MARMIPDDRVPGEFGNSYAEEILYHLLREKLSSDYTVIHAMQWERSDDESDADFVVFHHRRGILAIEVKGGKGSGDVSYSNGRWLYSNGEPMKKYGPMEQAKRSKRAIIGELPSYKLYPVEAAVWFPFAAQVRGEHPPGLQKEQVLLKGHLEDPQKAIEAIFDYYGMQETAHQPEDRTAVLNALAPLFRLVLTKRDKYDAHESRFLRLTRQQYYLLDYLEEQRVAAIQGGAGTGKTLLAEEKTRRLANTGKVLFLCYNSFLCDKLRERNKDLYLAGKADFHNLNSLVKRALGYDPTDEEISEYLNNITPGDWEYSHVIIDEGQDIYWEDIWRLYDIAKEIDGTFYVFYDRNQRVQQKGRDRDTQKQDGLAWLELMECRLVLSRNCRNTQSIAFTSHRPVRSDGRKNDLELEEELPSLWMVDTIEEAREKTAQLIRHYIQGKLRPDEIVILSMKGKGSSRIFAEGEKVGGYDLIDRPGAAGILFTTARMFKGLEAAAVIVVDIDEHSFEKDHDSGYGSEEPSEAAKLLYVAASRAKTNLDLIAILDDIQKRKIATLLTGVEKKRPIPVIEAELGVKVP